jgi:hypothetical protein
MKVCKLLLAITSVSILFGALTSAASARRVLISANAIRTTFREMRFVGERGPLNCPLTLEGSLHSTTITKVAGSLIGYITRVVKGFCSIGTATVLPETLPWHVRYQSFSGTLPSIASVTVNVIGFSLRYRESEGLGIFCNIRSTEAEPLTVTYRIGAGVIRGAMLGGTISTTFEECLGTRFTFRSDEGTASVLGAATALSVTLI